MMKRIQTIYLSFFLSLSLLSLLGAELDYFSNEALSSIIVAGDPDGGCPPDDDDGES